MNYNKGRRGKLQGRGIRLCTDYFNKPEVVRLNKIFLVHYGPLDVKSHYKILVPRWRARVVIFFYDALLFFILFSQFVCIAGGSEVGTSASLLSFKTYEGIRGEAPVYRTKEILFGSILGDGQLEMAPRSINARFGFTQALGQKDYFESVCTSLSTLCSAKYREHSYVDKRTGKTYIDITYRDSALGLYYNFFYFIGPLSVINWFTLDKDGLLEKSLKTL
jgi:hypothetical protein